MRLLCIWALGSFAAMGLVWAAAQAAANEPAQHPHHHLHHALWELRDAAKEIREARHDFGGHKEKALHATHEAIKHLETVLKHTGDTRGTPTRGDLREEYKKYSHHPHLHHAVHELKHARHHLKESKHTFGGQKEAALHAIHHAIVQLELALKHARKS